MRDDSGRGDDAPTDGADGDDGREWRFDPQEFPDDEGDGEPTDGGPGGDVETDEGEGNVAGEFVPSGDVEPGTPTLGNAVWVVVGALIAVVGLPAIFPPFGLNPQVVLYTVGATLLIAVLLMGFFGILTPDT